MLYFSMAQPSEERKITKISAWKTYSSACAQQQQQRSPQSPPMPVLADPTNSGGSRTFRYSALPASHFPGHKLFPFTFFLRHYPIRSQEHGERKVFKDPNYLWLKAEERRTFMTARGRRREGYAALRQGHDFLMGEEESEKKAFRTHDNGDIPASFFSPFLPCRDPTVAA